MVPFWWFKFITGDSQKKWTELQENAKGKSQPMHTKIVSYLPNNIDSVYTSRWYYPQAQNMILVLPFALKAFFSHSYLGSNHTFFSLTLILRRSFFYFDGSSRLWFSLTTMALVIFLWSRLFLTYFFCCYRAYIFFSSPKSITRLTCFSTSFS